MAKSPICLVLTPKLKNIAKELQVNEERVKTAAEVYITQHPTVNSDTITATQIKEVLNRPAADIISSNNIEGYTSEMQTIKEKAIANGTFMKAPNGNPTNLNEKQWLQVRTKVFKDWFGDWKNDSVNASKVIGKNGEPLVVYHGTADTIEEFNYNGEREWNSGFFFTSDKEYAQSVADSKQGDIIMPVFLNMRNPIITNTPLVSEGVERIYIMEGTENSDGIIGHDLNTGEFKKSKGTEYLVSKPNQVKSATDNIGTFSTTDDNIYHENQVTDLGTIDKTLKEFLSKKSLSFTDIIKYLKDNEEYKDILKAIQSRNKARGFKLLDGIKLQVLGITQSGGVSQDIREKLKGHRAVYDASNRTIYIDAERQYTNGDARSVVMHELLHAMTVERILANEQFRKEITPIIDAYYAKYEDPRYRPTADHRIEEFVADVWSDPETIKNLKNTPAIDNTESTLWESVKTFFRNIFSEVFGKTMYAQVSDKIFNLLEQPEMIVGTDIYREDLESKTIEYTPTGKQRQTYTIKGSHIYNKDGKEVFANNSVDRNRIFANLAVQEGRAVVVKHKDIHYVVNNRNQIISVATGKIMQWSEENGDRKAILEEAQKKFDTLQHQNSQSLTQKTGEISAEVRKDKAQLDSVIGTDSEAKSEVSDAIKVAQKGISFEEALANQEAIFTKEEQEQIKSALNGKNLQVMSVSRQTDPVFFSKEIIAFLEQNSYKAFNDPTRINAVEIWSKHDGLPIQDILEACKKYKVAPMMSFSITGLGGTTLEGGVMKYNDLLDRIEQLIKVKSLNPVTTTIRIDPILIGETNMEDIRKIVERSKALGIKKFVTSLVQSYGYTEGTSKDRKVVSGINNALAAEDRTYDWDKYYGRDRNGKINFKPKQQYIDEIGKVLIELDSDPNITIQTCAFGIKGLKVSACLDPLIIERITGVNVLRKDGTYDRDTSRPECMCYGAHSDMFRVNEKKCFSSCAYCYAAHSGDNKLNYYNEDGTIKDIPYTKVNQTAITSSITPQGVMDKVTQKYQGNWSRQEAQNNPRILYVFTDNTDRDSGSGIIPRDSWYSKKYGEGHHFPTMTAAVVRGLENARPISTQRWYHQGAKGTTGRWTDASVEEFTKVIEEELQEIVREFNTGKYDTIMFPDGDGLFNTNISNITKERTPKLYDALSSLLDKYGFNSLIPRDKVTSNISKEDTADFTDILTQLEDQKIENSEVKEETPTNVVVDPSFVPMPILQPSVQEAKKSSIDTVYTQQQLRFRKLMVAQEFADAVRTLIAEDLDNLEEQIEQFKNTYKKPSEASDNERIQYYNNLRHKRKWSEDTVFGMQNWFKDNNGKNGEDSGISRALKETKRILIEEYGEDTSLSEEIRKEYKKAADRIVELFVLAQDTVKDLTGLAVNPSFEEIVDPESFLEVANGNDGWGMDNHSLNPHQTASIKLKELLATLESGQYDDLGRPVLVDGHKAFNIILQAVEKIHDDADFSVKNSNGTLTFPILEKLRGPKNDIRYSWMQEFIDYITENPEYAAMAFSTFRVKFHEVIGASPHTKNIVYSMNTRMETDELLDKAINNYEAGIDLTNKNESIYTQAGLTNKEAVDKSFDLVNTYLVNLPKFITDGKVSDIKELNEYASKIAYLFKTLGINADIIMIKSWIRNLNEMSSEERSSIVGEIQSATGRILGAFNKATTPGIITDLKGYYKTILENLGNIDTLSGIKMYRHANKMHSSYTSPSTADLILEKLTDTNTSRRADTLKKYKSSYVFASGNTWRNFWLSRISNDRTTRNKMAIKQLLDINTREYAKWTDEDIAFAMVSTYRQEASKEGSTMGTYFFPIFADAEAGYTITAPRISGIKDAESVKDSGILDQFLKVIDVELDRINLVSDRYKNGEATIANFDQFSDKKSQGSMFQYFPEFNTHYTLQGEIDWDKTFRFGETDMNGNPNPYAGMSVAQALKKILEKNNTSFATAMTVKPVKEMFKEAIFESINTIANQFYNSAISNSSLMLSLRNATQDESEIIYDFVWNNALAQIQIIQIFGGDPAFYKNAIEFQKRWKEVYAAGARMFTNSTYGRKTCKMIVLKDFMKSSHSIKGINDALKEAETQGRITKTQRESILKEYTQITSTDGQAFRSPKSFRAVLDMMGKWTKEMQETIERLCDNTWTYADYDTVLNTLKGFAYSLDFKELKKNSTTSIVQPVPQQSKNSEALILSMFTMMTGQASKNPILSAIGKFMDAVPAGQPYSKNNFNDGAYNLDVVQFNSAMKTGVQIVLDPSYSRVKLKSIKDNTANILKKISLNWESIKKASTTKSTDDIDIYRSGIDNLALSGKITDSQASDLYHAIDPTEREVMEYLEENVHNQDATNTIDNPNVVREYSYENYMQAMPTPDHIFDSMVIKGTQFANIIDSDIEQIEDKVFKISGSDKLLNGKEVKELFQQIEIANLTEDYLKFVKTVNNPEKLREALLSQMAGNPKYTDDVRKALDVVPVDPSDPNSPMKFKVPIINPTTKRTIQELLASMVVNRITKQKMKGGAAILESDFGFSRDLKIVFEGEGKDKHIAYAECYLPITSKENFLPYINDNGELNTKLVPDDLLRMIGYRIPTEHKSSMLPLKVVGFLPMTKGATIVLPADTLIMAGEDFDVDKKFLAMLEYDNPTITKKAQEEFISDFLGILKEKELKGYHKAEVREALSLYKKGMLTTSDARLKTLYKEFTDFINTPGFEEAYGTLGFKKISYDMDKTPIEQSRKARNNMLVELAYSILTNPNMSDQMFRKQGADDLKRESYVISILADESLRNYWAQEHNIASTDLISIHKNLESTSVAELKKFNDQYEKVISYLNPNTFINFHQQNMTGKTMIAAAASGESMYFKYQNSGLKTPNKIKLFGKNLSALDNVYDWNGNLISYNFAQILGAAADNAKDPILGRLKLGTKDFNYMATLLKLGIPLDKATLLYSSMLNLEEEVFKAALNKGFLDLKSLIGYCIFNKISLEVTEEDVLNTITISKDDLEKTITELVHISNGTLTNYRPSKSILVSTILYLRLTNIEKDLRKLGQISRTDTTNGSVESNWGEAIYHYAKSSIITSNGFKSIVDTKHAIPKVSSTKIIDTDLQSVFERFKNSRLQAFWTLGYEQPLFHILDTANVGTIFAEIAEYSIKHFKNELDAYSVEEILQKAILYTLSTTEFFGTNNNETYEQKHNYYTFQFPSKAVEFKKNHPDIVTKNNFLQRLGTNNGDLFIKDSARLDAQTINILRADIKQLMELNNPEVTLFIEDLIKYAYYVEGLDFSGNGITRLLPLDLLMSIPGYVEALENMPNLFDTGNNFINFENQCEAALFNLYFADGKYYLDANQSYENLRDRKLTQEQMRSLKYKFLEEQNVQNQEAITRREQQTQITSDETEILVPEGVLSSDDIDEMKNNTDKTGLCIPEL